MKASSGWDPRHRRNDVVSILEVTFYDTLEVKDGAVKVLGDAV